MAYTFEKTPAGKFKLLKALKEKNAKPKSKDEVALDAMESKMKDMSGKRKDDEKGEKS